MEHVLLVISIFLLILGFQIRIKKIESDNIKIKNKFDILAEKFECPELSMRYVSDELKTKLEKLLNEDKKIEAIKVLRQNLDLSLAEAKNYVESL